MVDKIADTTAESAQFFDIEGIPHLPVGDVHRWLDREIGPNVMSVAAHVHRLPDGEERVTALQYLNSALAMLAVAALALRKLADS